MPRRVKPQWGKLGVICVRGAGQTDDEFAARGIVPGKREPGDRGCRQDDAQFGLLASHLTFPHSSMLPRIVRARLDFIREFHLKSRLLQAQTPARREQNAALAELKDGVEAFIAVAVGLETIPDWVLPTPIETPPHPSHLHVFITLPQRLRDLAWAARAVAKGRSAEEADTLISFSNHARWLGDALALLDHATRNDVLCCLPKTTDYELQTQSAVVRASLKLRSAVAEALAAGRKTGGPAKYSDLLQTVAWLGDLYEGCGGKFRHTPRERGRYDGIPRSKAGRFIVKFFETCDPTLHENSISCALQRVIELRNERKQARGGSFGLFEPATPA